MTIKDLQILFSRYTGFFSNFTPLYIPLLKNYIVIKVKFIITLINIIFSSFFNSYSLFYFMFIYTKHIVVNLTQLEFIKVPIELNKGYLFLI